MKGGECPKLSKDGEPMGYSPKEFALIWKEMTPDERLECGKFKRETPDSVLNDDLYKYYLAISRFCGSILPDDIPEYYKKGVNEILEKLREFKAVKGLSPCFEKENLNHVDRKPQGEPDWPKTLTNSDKIFNEKFQALTDEQRTAWAEPPPNIQTNNGTAFSVLRKKRLGDLGWNKIKEKGFFGKKRWAYTGRVPTQKRGGSRTKKQTRHSKRKQGTMRKPR